MTPDSERAGRERLLDRVVRHVALPNDDSRAQVLLDTEWLVTNGLGGYASGTAAGVVTRRYHGMLVSALPNPTGRTVMLNHLSERLVLPDGRSTFLGGEERVAGKLDPAVAARVADMRLEAGLPVWEFAWEGVRLEKRVVMPHRQNTVIVTFRLLDGGDVQPVLELHPAVHFRGYEERVDTQLKAPGSTQYRLDCKGELYTITADDSLPPLRMHLQGGTGPARFEHGERVTSEFLYPVEQSRGYEFRGTLWTPGHFSVPLGAGGELSFVASTETEDVMLALTAADALTCEVERRRRLARSAAPQAHDETGAELVLAADQFIIKPEGRVADATRAAALGNEIRTVIAGYHWFTDWGRDTMISLEGLTLTTGRHREAGFILRTFGYYVRDGLIPNLFPDGSNDGLYHTADATMWFFHAIERYVRSTGDESMLLHLLPKLTEIVDLHVRGTRFGIHVDPADGLLVQGAKGYQLTWMDAKVDGWVVTPRRGKAVEINALWYNALRLLQSWLERIRGTASAQPLKDRADRVYESFNKRFWMPERGFLYDVVDGENGDDALCRPNQILSLSLEHPVLDPDHWADVVSVVQERLLTPFGLRSLAPGEPDYRPRYFGDLRSRDAAYHQGTVWAWLIGPWVDAWLRVHPEDREGARRYLDGCITALGEYGLGTIGEIFDAEAPYTPRGCIAQAWSVAEVLRCWVKTAPIADRLVGATSRSGGGAP